MIRAAQAARTFLDAARLNRQDPLRSGSLLEFPDYGQVVMTGDLHGHRRNFERLKRYCAPERFGARHVILHEIIHQDLAVYEEWDESHRVLLEAAQWKCEFPAQVHFLLSNHELAQINRSEIIKNGRVVTVDFEQSVRSAYEPEGREVLDALYEFIQSFPLAGRTPNRVFLSHSLPAPNVVPEFDVSVFSRTPGPQDLVDRGAAHALVWGRYHTPEALDELSRVLDADIFICGHQPQETGFAVVHDKLIILASDHNHGVFLPFDLKKRATMEGLVRNIRPFVSIA